MATTLLRRHGERHRKRTAAVTAVTAVAATAAGAVGAVAARRHIDHEGEARQRTTRKVTTIRRPAGELYAYWRSLENLPRFTAHVESIEATGPTTSHWVAKAPAGVTVSWDAEIVEDVPGEIVAWRSLDGADVPNTGHIRFSPAPGDQGTEVSVEITFTPPLGAAGLAAAKVFGEEPSQQVGDDLRRFKQLMETGEVVVSQASPAGPTSAALLRQRPAQPLG